MDQRLRVQSFAFGNCQICGKDCSNRCSACKAVFYCCKLHQQQHWPLHKRVCTPEASNKDDKCTGGKLTNGVFNDRNNESRITSEMAYRLYDEYIGNDKSGIFVLPNYHSQLNGLNIEFEDTEIPGLKIIQSFLTEEEHDHLASMALLERGESFGKDEMYRGPYDNMKITMPYISSVEMYFILKRIVGRLIGMNLIPHFPHQLTINYYEPNQGLLNHTDNVDVIKEHVVGISLLSSCVINFTKCLNGKVESRYSQQTSSPSENEVGYQPVRQYFLHPGSVMIQSGEVRYQWQHGIEANPIHRIGKVTVVRQFRISLQLSDFDSQYFHHPEVQKLML